MDIIEQEDRLEAAGFKREQVRELIRFVTSGDTQAMSKSDGDRLDQRLSAKIDGVDARLTDKIDSVDARLTAKIDGVDARLTAKIDALSLKIDSMTSKLIATSWTVGGVAVGILAAIRFFD